MTDQIYDVAIVGTGPAGLTAAIYAARANLQPIMFAGIQHGGQLTTTTEVENFPGFEHGIQGPELMRTMTAQAERFGTKIMYEHINEVDFSKDIKTLVSDGKTYRAKTVIIATGATAKTLGLAHESELMGRGLSTCATCDGFFYRNKKVAVVGGGDSAMEEATYLSKICAEVYLIHRRDVFKASPIMHDRVRKNPKIKIMVPFTIGKTLFDEKGLSGAELVNTENGKSQDLMLDGLFYAIGHTPNSKIFIPYVDVDANGYVKVHDYTKTKTPGVFAAGDIADSNFRQAITAAGMGCQAAMQAQRYLEGH